MTRPLLWTGLSVAVIVVLSPAAATALEPAELVGIWQMCYEPGAPGVDELSAGYLVLMPDRKYFELREDCCAEAGEPLVGQSGEYRVEDQTVVLRARRADGQAYERRLELVPAAVVVLFDDLRGPPSRRPVLRAGRGVNYGFAKVFPRAP